MDTLFKEAEAEASEMVRVRRDLHTHPELGFQESRTAGIVADALENLGLPTRRGVGGTGVVALIEGARAGPCVLVRADMDALPIVEANDVPYRSTREGVMHACGHDGHVAIGLAVAKMLAARRDRMGGSVKLVFQPAEETLDGAKTMISSGVLDDPTPTVSLGLHLMSESPVGTVAVVPGPVMAASDRFTIDVLGGGGHGAYPHMARDPVLAAAHVVTALQSVVARNVPPLESAVVSVTTVTSGSAFNIIPPSAQLTGTIRTFRPEVQDVVHARVTDVAQHVARGLGCDARVRIERGVPPVVNDPVVTARVAALAARVPGVTRVDAERRTMGGEDMAYFLERAPGCFFFVGCHVPGAPPGPSHHSPTFDFDERALPIGAALLAGAAWELVGAAAGPSTRG